MAMKRLKYAGLVIVLGVLEDVPENTPEVMPTSTGLAFLRFITDPGDNLEAAVGPHP